MDTQQNGTSVSHNGTKMAGGREIFQRGEKETYLDEFVPREEKEWLLVVEFIHSLSDKCHLPDNQSNQRRMLLCYRRIYLNLSLMLEKKGGKREKA
ncbi:hypothetical protein P8452_61472 [Trifolium repens]|nr:hypothetical protein P8452_61472 [Trifolium repens]